MKKMLSGLVVAAFALVAVAPASAALVAPRVAGPSSIEQVQQSTAPKATKKKKTASKKAPAKKQVAKKGAKKAAPKTA
jgi:hypothetical protein